MAAIQTRMYALKACVGMRVMSEGPGSATDVSSGQADGLKSQTDASDMSNSAETAVVGHAGATWMRRVGPT